MTKNKKEIKLTPAEEVVKRIYWKDDMRKLSPKTQEMILAIVLKK